MATHISDCQCYIALMMDWLNSNRGISVVLATLCVGALILMLRFDVRLNGKETAIVLDRWFGTVHVCKLADLSFSHSVCARLYPATDKSTVPR